MLINEKNQLDTRNFVEIYGDLCKKEKSLLYLALLAKSVVTSRQAIWMWSKGKTTPHITKQNLVAKELAKVTGYKYEPKTLFPLR